MAGNIHSTAETVGAEHVAYIGTYPPRQCGIGTFTRNLFTSMSATSTDTGHENFVIAINDHNLEYSYPPEVKLVVAQEQQSDYLEAANFINLSGADVCILQHEFGIYGGHSGVYILPLIYRLSIPVIVTLHTILESPSYNERAILKAICKMTAKVVVMTRKGESLLKDIYHVSPDKIVCIEHGVPDIHFESTRSRNQLKLAHKKVLLTFGFIGRNKGIETVIKSLPEVVKKHPRVIYLVLGKTHPNVLRHSGEEYRTYLQLLVDQLNLSRNVLFLNEYLSEQDLFKYLAACDVYITPYTNEAQITSGTLSYAMGAGCAVLSTPYWHAAELLKKDRGILFDFNDSEQLAVILDRLFSNSDELSGLKRNARKYGKHLTWPKTGKKYQALVQKLVDEPAPAQHDLETQINLLLLPKFSLAHISRLTDDTGIIQHAKFGIPNLKEGYCLDDNARALLVSLMAYNQKKDGIALEKMPVYLSYIHYMQKPNGLFRNFLSFKRDFLDNVGSEDSFGRTIWALGYLLGNAPNDAYYQTGKLIFFDAAPNFENLKSIRSIANTMIGISYYLRRNPMDDEMTERLRNLADKLIEQYRINCSGSWHWFEALLAYDNGILPLALLHASELLNQPEISRIAMESMNFLTETTMKDGYLSIIGNKEWYKKDGTRSTYAQQPIDAMAMVLMYHQAFHLTRDKEYLNKLFVAFMWFLGENDLRLSLYDFETKGCCDGFENYGVNRNQGAESSLAYLISHLTVLQAHEEFYQLEE